MYILFLNLFGSVWPDNFVDNISPLTFFYINDIKTNIKQTIEMRC